MLKHFDSLFDLMDAFPDEQACIDHLRSIRWKDGEFCPHCGSNKVYHFSDRKTFKCGDCKDRFSIKVGTIFEDTKLPLRKWFMAIWLITNHPKGIASTTLAKDIKITQKSAWFVMHRLRHAAQREECSAAELDDDRFFGRGQDRALWLRPHGRIRGFAAVAPFQDRFEVEAVLTGEETGRRFRRFEFGSNSRRRSGAAVKNACHSASSS